MVHGSVFDILFLIFITDTDTFLESSIFRFIQLSCAPSLLNVSSVSIPLCVYESVTLCYEMPNPTPDILSKNLGKLFWAIDSFSCVSFINKNIM